MSRSKKYIAASLLSFVLLIAAYATAVAHPGTVVTKKICTSWELAKNRAFIMTHKQANQPLLDSKALTLADNADRVPVLMYHYIAPKADISEPDNNSMIDLESFEQGMIYLHTNGYKTATMEQLEKYINGEGVLPDKSVVITFDDGYQNNIIYAYPIFKKYGFHATMFVVGTHIQQKTASFDSKKTSFLSTEEMNASSDVFEFHSHTYDLHKKGTAVCGIAYSSLADASLITNDIHKIKELGIDSPYFAYPYGEANTQIIYKLRENGYRMAFSVRSGFAEPGTDPMMVPRLTVTSSTDMHTLLHPEASLN
ncbi:Polysaccharide deacetylase [Paenibacillus algorifonticola]|uniref:Polysaccharide deacetylase n=1 Tax=Paenibacillus algorifonticola TaxID=684063 RepID=A0A1I1ZXF3_9BACL|nr:polysaccharide deacetylase family protein [Paenibacillus algorifonticola]SFE36078.1 Polysaccharide deacetylase [Paenibacillus algorifonticola]